MLESQVFVWEMQKRGVDLHLQADPTRAQLLARKIMEGSKTVKSKIDQEIIDTYGCEKYLQPLPKDLIYGQSQSYFEYDSSGRQIKGPQKPKVLSRYEEDVYKNNHSSIWGSYWKCGRWGYKCCHSLEKASYCLGDAGMKIEREADMQQSIEEGSNKVVEVLSDKSQTKKSKKRKSERKNETEKVKTKKRRTSNSSDSSSSRSNEKYEKEIRKREKQIERVRATR